MADKKRIPPADELVGGPDASAIAEAEVISRGEDLEKAAELAQHERREGARDTVARLLNFGIRVLFGIILIAGLVWAYHLLTPTCWHWLTEEQLSSIKESFFSATIGFAFGVITKFKFL